MLPLAQPAQQAVTLDPSHKDILIIGNSYSVDSLRYVSEIAQNIGADIDVYLAQQGGRTVYELYTNHADTTYYSFYKNTDWIGTASLDNILEQRRFDAVVMQNYWGTSGGILYYANDTYNASKTDAYKNMALYLREKQPGAEILINAVWSNENGYNETQIAQIAAADSEFANSPRQNAVQRWMYDQMEKFNGQAAIDCGEAVFGGKTLGDGGFPLRQLPVGYAIQLAREYPGSDGNYPFATTMDDTVKHFADMTPGELCPIGDADAAAGRLRLNRDGYHLSVAGRYLAGLVWIEYLTGYDVSQVVYIPGSEIINCGYQATGGDGTTTTEAIAVSFDALTAQQASILRSIAHRAVRNFEGRAARGLNDSSIGFSYNAD